MRKMPPFWSRKWRQLWFAGAIPQDIVFFRTLADRLEQAKKEHPWYFEGDDPEKIREGVELEHFSIGLVDMMAFVAGELRLSRWEKHNLYDTLTARLLKGHSARWWVERRRKRIAAASATGKY